MTFKTMIRGVGVAAAGCLLAMSMAFADEAAKTDWISFTGEIVTGDGDGFVINDGGASVQVSMADWVWYNERSQLPAGEVVTVYGAIDPTDEGRFSVDADSVFVHGRDTFYFAEDSNKEVGYTMYAQVANFEDGKRVNVAGLVIWKEGRDMAIDTGSDVVAVDSRAIIDDQFDNARYNLVQPGDIVAVSGHLDSDFLSRRLIVAQTVLPVVMRDREDIFLSIKTALVSPTRG